jgi:hypothetical protein
MISDRIIYRGQLGGHDGNLEFLIVLSKQVGTSNEVVVMVPASFSNTEIKSLLQVLMRRFVEIGYMNAVPSIFPTLTRM